MRASQSESESLSLPDSLKDHPTLIFAPEWLKPYVQLARLDRPVGWWLLLLPCWASNCLASGAAGQVPNILQLFLFFVGAVAMRGAGSTYNDIIDRTIDAQVERTRNRPLPSGRTTPGRAKAFLALQCAIGLIVLGCFNAFTFVLGCASLLIVGAYPFMKRVTSWPQAVLGLAFSWGALMGWAAVFASLATPAVLLYASAVFWTIGYDTIYAVQDARDDAIIGVRSTARLFGANLRFGVGAFYFASVLCAFAASGWAGAAWPATLGCCGYAAHLAWQVFSIRRDDPEQALKLFRSNRDAGLLLFAGFFCAAL